MPEAPVRFSTMNCCFSDSDSLPAKSRASGSTEPPGGYGETNLTTRLGHSCACAVPARTKKATRTLKTHIASSLELEHLPGIVRRCHHQPQLFQDAACLRNLL